MKLADIFAKYCAGGNTRQTDCEDESVMRNAGSLTTNLPETNSISSSLEPVANGGQLPELSAAPETSPETSVNFRKKR